VYPAWDDSKTDPDMVLASAFESTQPGIDRAEAASWFDDIPTGQWVAFTAVGFVAGVLVGRWWMGRYERGREALAAA
jgi:hypothetical protein